MTETLSACNPPKEFKIEFMEKYSCFISKHDWKDILEICTDRLAKLGCECKAEKFSLHCTLYIEKQGESIPFVVNVFSSRSSAEEYVVEFQRRCSGNLLEFIDLYATFIQQDEGCGMVVRNAHGPRSGWRKSLEPDSFVLLNSVILNQDNLECLMHFLKSDYYDIRTEGLAQLAKCVQTEANCLLMYRYPSIFSTLAAFLDDDYDKIAYPVLIILKFLLETGGKDDAILPGEVHRQLSSKLSILLDKKLNDRLVSGDVYKRLMISVSKLLSESL
jgi:hypothetical protein